MPSSSLGTVTLRADLTLAWPGPPDSTLESTSALLTYRECTVVE